MPPPFLPRLRARTKLVLALLASVGVLFCASLSEGLPRAAMLGAGAVLLLLVVYDLATGCDSACQQTRAEGAQQRTSQNQARLAALSPPSDPLCDWSVKPIVLGPDPIQLHDDRCSYDLQYSNEGQVELYVTTYNNETLHGPFHRGQQFPDGAITVINNCQGLRARASCQKAVTSDSISWNAFA